LLLNLSPRLRLAADFLLLGKVMGEKSVALDDLTRTQPLGGSVGGYKNFATDFRKPRRLTGLQQFVKHCTADPVRLTKPIKGESTAFYETIRFQVHNCYTPSYGRGPG
jgi:hypothetical protein